MPSVMERSGSGVLSRSRAKTVTNGNSQHSEEESSDEEHTHADSMIRVGGDYQAQIPEFKPDCASRYSDSDQRSMLVWSPNSQVSDAMLDEYILMAKEKHGYNMEQALGMLLWHKHDVEKSLADLANFTPFPDEWTVEDKVLFEQAFSFHGKSFHRIQQMLPDKLISSLVKYYYSWKKTRTRTSVMDRQARRLLSKREKDESHDEIEEGDPGSDSDFEINARKETSKQSSGNGGGSDKGSSKPGLTRKENQGAQYRHHPLRARRRPPKGMHLEQEDIVGLSASTDSGAVNLRQLDTQLVSLKRQVQSIKQTNSVLKHNLGDGIEGLRPSEPTQKINSRWTTEEHLLTVQAIRRYGKDFAAIADVIGNKTVAQISSFFVSYRRRFNLEEVLREWQAEQEVVQGGSGRAVNMELNGSSGAEDDEVQMDGVSPPLSDSPLPSSDVSVAGNPNSAQSSPPLTQPPPLLRPAPPSAPPSLLRQPPPLQTRPLQNRTPHNHPPPPPPLIRPAVASSLHQGALRNPLSSSSAGQLPPSLVGLKVESPQSH
ncbi:REST corepressor 2 isoform X1 [Carassius auratus]|uniref:REST corepressor 2 n=1 Tax=Carassius auratus TaxID=7957 RepID=A0A6P6PMX6_CARAU|nr:REST corepressor 2 isoform X1 [Carassius auratus]XP_026122947.1 REST corepressor 2 isoform X1 [Carassius auratus]XP_052416078.1 REST corepressor 2 isoform X1 [Carassius gibelio]XP_052416079.1 REST corepressor 2 isoform X1 [Carassius gibelio]XP_052416080.1 REST corepressor 2 isoform X1 [Carassius gibelio]XP_052416081.1 REST corepressor 2 isoform X1 [Carassius gibelio]XP_052416082.1 REST corepressor 2 isoform X1 [Carassius gibelio]XP_052416083.1 REST corepressor 2 isoform X1 [Carassius gibe